MTGPYAGDIVQYDTATANYINGHNTTGYCYSSEFFNSYSGEALVFEDGDGSLNRLQFRDIGGTYSPAYLRPEVPVQVKNEDSEGPTSSNTLKFSDFPNIRDYAIKMIGDFGKDITNWDWDMEHTNQLLISHGTADEDYVLGENSYWKGQLKQILTGQAFCDYYGGTMAGHTKKTCGINKWTGQYGPTSIGMGQAASSTFDRIGGPPITEPFTYSKVMDYLLYVFLIYII